MNKKKLRRECEECQLSPSSSLRAGILSPHPTTQTQAPPESVVPDGTISPPQLSSPPQVKKSPQSYVPYIYAPVILASQSYGTANKRSLLNATSKSSPVNKRKGNNGTKICGTPSSGSSNSGSAKDLNNNLSHNIMQEANGTNQFASNNNVQTTTGSNTNVAYKNEPNQNGSNTIATDKIEPSFIRAIKDSSSFKMPYKNLPTHPLENPEVDKHYATLTLNIIKTLFKKECDCGKSDLKFFAVKNRPTTARCRSCHKQVSITSNTPLHKFLLPLSYFSYILHDSILQYPKVVTSSEISRKLNIPYKTAYLLKRRIQLVASMLNNKLRESVKGKLKAYAEENPLVLPKGEDLRPILEHYPVASSDAVVLYSSSVKANKYRSRRFRTGSSSIYRSNNLGGDQVGTMVHTIGIKGSYSFYKSIPLTKQEYLNDDLATVVPREIPLFTDEGYKFIWDRKNHRMVNHSKKSKDPRYNMSRERWVTKEGVSSNISEGRNNVLKQAFRSYYYVSPKWSQVYLDEHSFFGNLRYEEDLARLMFTGSYSGETVVSDKYTKAQYSGASKRNTSTNSCYYEGENEINGAFELEQFVGRSNEKCGRRDLNSPA